MRGILDGVQAGFIADGRPFDRAMAQQVGLREEQVTALVKSGRLRQPLRGVYLDARLPDDLASRAACLALRLPPGAVVSRLSAAWLYGVDGRTPEELALPPVVECVVPRSRQPLRRRGIRCYAASVADDVTVVDGIPVTTALRTALDLLRWLPPHMGLAVADALAKVGLVTRDDLVARAADSPRLRGIAKARCLADLVEPATESFGESWLRLRIVDAGFPRPTVQIEVLDGDGRCLYRLDMGWEERMVAVEYDGEAYHSSPEQVRRDRRRREFLERQRGWQLLAVGRGEVLGSSLALERGIGELLSLEPRILRRTW